MEKEQDRKVGDINVMHIERKKETFAAMALNWQVRNARFSILAYLAFYRCVNLTILESLLIRTLVGG